MNKVLIVGSIVLVGGFGLLAATGALVFVLISGLNPKDFAYVDIETVVTVEPAGTRVQAMVTSVDVPLPSELIVKDREYDPKFHNGTSSSDAAEYSVKADRTEISVERISDSEAQVSYLVGIRENGHRAVVLDSPFERTGPRQIEARVNGDIESCLLPGEFDITDRSYVWTRACAGGPVYVVDERQEDGLSLPVWLRMSFKE